MLIIFNVVRGIASRQYILFSRNLIIHINDRDWLSFAISSSPFPSLPFPTLILIRLYA